MCRKGKPGKSLLRGGWLLILRLHRVSAKEKDECMIHGYFPEFRECCGGGRVGSSCNEENVLSHPPRRTPEVESLPSGGMT